MLTDVKCRNAICPPDRRKVRFADTGGMYLQVSPAGSKRWFLKYRIDGKEKQLAMGSYPDVSLTSARNARDTAKLQKAKGNDPLQARKLEKMKYLLKTDGTFKSIALDWHAKQLSQWSDGHGARLLRDFERDLFPSLGDRPIEQIHAMELLGVLHKVE